MRYEKVIGLFALGFGLLGCKGPAKAPTVEKKTEATSQPATASAQAESVPLAEGWARIDLEDAPTTEKEKLEEARKAMKALGSMLVKELTEAVGEGNFARGVEVCQEAAPKIAKMVSEEYDVDIGRTSFKVRNPENRPRRWAEPIVQARVQKELLLEGPDGKVAYMAPIKLAEVCVKCHGTAEQIPDDVEKMLAEKYPEDEATGFAPGDLRGWFWVEFDGSEGS